MYQQRGCGLGGGGQEVEAQWKDFWRDPSDCWDNKPSPRHPDFKHKLTKQPLWTGDRDNTSWVMEELINCRFTSVDQCIEAGDSLSPSLIWACCKNKDLWRGSKIHNELQRRGLVEKNYAEALITMYAKCGELQQAQGLLDMYGSSSIVPWNALIAGYAREGKSQRAFDCFEHLQLDGLRPSAVTYTCILKACAMSGAIDKGKQVHNVISMQGLLEHHVALGSALIDMYAKCGALCQAQSVLEKLPSRDVVSWSTLIGGYAQNGQGQEALDCFEQMQREGILPNEVTFVCVLNACAASGAIDKGKQIHDEISAQGLLEHNAVLGNALVSMYAKCGALCQAHSVLKKLPSRDVISWNSLIAGYAQSGKGQQALDCFNQMQSEGIIADEVTYACILKACAVIGAVDKGKQIHDEISMQGLLEHHVGLGGALVDMYVKCGALDQAQSVLQKLPSRNVVSWSALIAGYAHNGQGQQALDCFEQMQSEGILANEVTYACILKACGLIGAIDQGKKIHDEILRQGWLEHNAVLGNTLVDMYAKCGALQQAKSVLEKLPSRSIVSWNSMIAGYAQNGQSQEALVCFEQMQRESILPDEVTFICLLNLCSHLGLVEKGQELFNSMDSMYGLKPSVDSFTCMVDLLGRAGHLVKAAEVIQGMPFSTNSAIWHCLLSACTRWIDVNVGTWAFQQAVKLDKCDVTACVLMVNIYAAGGMLMKAKDIEAMRIKLMQQLYLGN
ncbi:hypothetical protein GOP47_0022152 [Adiantum capillus-veneris]|uniref:Pentatricopeptide repeat-containing protein n=1 Tax=Adiantum capillus-veneris TaxID=13818 RepID=A0A9D4U930_ADICA|nr:hypothetical protein GOP47_0022152 [Adiantum capillus-veneris]